MQQGGAVDTPRGERVDTSLHLRGLRIPAIMGAGMVLGVVSSLVALRVGETWRAGLGRAGGFGGFDALWFFGVILFLGAWAGVRLRRADRAARARQRERDAALEALHAEQALWHAIADASPDAMFAKDRHGYYTLFNGEAARITGFRLESGRRMCDADLFPQAQAESLRADDLAVMRDGRTITVEDRLDTVDGARVVLGTKGPLRDADGNIVGVYGVTRDVTERKRAQERLMLAAQAFESAELGMAICAAPGAELLDVNPALARMVGRSRSTLVGMELDALFLASSLPTLHAALARGDVDDHIDFEAALVSHNGHHVDVEVDIVANRDGLGRPHLRILHFIDITRRKSAEARLALYVKAFEQSGLAMAIADAASGTLLDVNPAFAHERGFHRDAMVGQSALALYPAAERERVAAMHRQADASGHVRFDTFHLRRDGTRFPVRVDLTVTQDLDGHPLVRIGHVVDLTPAPPVRMLLGVG